MGRLLAKYRDWLLGAGLFCAALAQIGRAHV